MHHLSPASAKRLIILGGLIAAGVLAWILFAHLERERAWWTIDSTPDPAGSSSREGPFLECSFKTFTCENWYSGGSSNLAIANAFFLKGADIAFSTPRNMTFGMATIVELVLAPNGSDRTAFDRFIISEGPDPVRVVTGIDFALRMQATLAGPDFEIEPSGPQVRTILPQRPTKWTWTVIPKSYGADKILTLSLDAIVSNADKDLPPIYVETFTEHIEVDVGLWGRAVKMADEIKAVHAVAVALGGTLMAVGGTILRRSRRAEAKRKATTPSLAPEAEEARAQPDP